MEDECAGEEEGEGDINRLIANISSSGGGGGSSSKDEITMAEYHMHRTHITFVVRQLPSRGISFQVWPAASALCWVLDEMFWHHPDIKTTAHLNTRIPPEVVAPLNNEWELNPLAACHSQVDTGIPTEVAGPLNNGCELNLLAEAYSELGYIAHQLLQRNDKQTLRVLELGAGTGMVGIAAALLGAHVTITDLPHVLPNLEFNASANEESLLATKQGGSVCVKALRWGEKEDVVEVGHNFDLILASDVVYHEILFDPLLLTLKWLLLCKDEKAGNPILLMAHLRRWKKDARFFKKAKKLFNVRVVHRHAPLPGSRLGVIVYCFTNKEMNRVLV